MEKLGCTIACHWCGALCWGSRDHHEHSDITKIHHSSHQPEGLAGVHNKITKELRATPCHKVEDNCYMYYFGKEEPTSQRFEILKIGNLVLIVYTILMTLMCWFFKKLHKDLAKKYNLKPSPRDDLGKNGCLHLDYDGI